MKEEICIHGLTKIFCAICNPKPEISSKSREPKISKNHTVHGSNCLPFSSNLARKYVRIYTTNGRENDSFRSLDESTTFVHICGHLFLWTIHKILEVAPNLEMIQVIPPMKRKLNESHLALCEKHGVKIIYGHWQPERAWKDFESRSPFYKTQAKFFSSLEGEQKELFEELMVMKFDSALITSRYFCLNGEDFVPQWVIAKEFGFKSADMVISRKINSVIRYLDPTFHTGKNSIRTAEAMKAKVMRIRSFLTTSEITSKSISEAEKKVQSMGLEKLPLNFPLARLDELELLALAERDGRLSCLEREHPSDYWAIVYRFGLLDFQYRKLEDVGKLMDNITRERVRQLEERGFRLLEIAIDE